MANEEQLAIDPLPVLPPNLRTHLGEGGCALFMKTLFPVQIEIAPPPIGPTRPSDTLPKFEIDSCNHYSGISLRIWGGMGRGREEVTGQSLMRGAMSPVPARAYHHICALIENVESLCSSANDSYGSSPAHCRARRIVSCSVSGIGKSGGRTVVFSMIPNIFNASFVRAR